MNRPAPDGAYHDWISSLKRTVGDLGHVGVAVSGGGDSMALLDFARRAFTGTNTQVSVATVDHGLRPEAAAEIALVRTYCKRHKIVQRTLGWDGARSTGNLQDAARKARYALLADWATSEGIDVVLLGHTQDDLVETFLMRLSRSAGLDGLSAMSERFERDGVLFLRPILHLRRDALRHYLEDCAIEWAEDPTNDDQRYLRVRARAALAELAELGITPQAIAASAHHLAAARTVLEEVTRHEVQRRVTVSLGDVCIDLGGPPIADEVRRRVISKAVQWVGGSDYPPRASSLVELDARLSSGSRHTLNGCLVSRTANEIRIGREIAAVNALQGKVGAVWDRRWRVDGPDAPDTYVGCLGEGISSCPNWRDIGVPRETIMASPAIWRGEALVAAPFGGMQGAYRVVAPTLEAFTAALFTH